MAVITVENAQIKTSAVEIKTLTVSGKQVTLSVFRQIQEENIFDHGSLTLKGIPWGNINYFFGSDKSCSGTNWFNIVWQKGKELRRCALRKKYPEFLKTVESYSYDTTDELYNHVLHKELKERYSLKRKQAAIHDNWVGSKYFKEDYETKCIAYLENEIGTQYHQDFLLRTNENKLNELKNNLKIAKEYDRENDKKINEIDSIILGKIDELNKFVDTFNDLPHLFIAI